MAPNHDPRHEGGSDRGYALTGYPEDNPDTNEDENLAARLSDEVYFVLKMISLLLRNTYPPPPTTAAGT